MVPCSSPDEVAARWDDPRSGEWFAWNDFSLRRASAKKARQAHSEWKRPCVALYTIEKLAKRLPRISSSKPLLPSSLSPPSSPKVKGKGGGGGDLVSPVWRGAEISSAYSLTSEQSQSTFRALAPSELPIRSGALVAIDAEFFEASDGDAVGDAIFEALAVANEKARPR